MKSASRIIKLLPLLALFVFGPAGATMITTFVPGDTNLYHDDWGHAYNVTGGGNEYDALGRGSAPTAVNFAFSAGQALDITATGCAVDSGPNCTGPDGHGWLFRGLPVYSLIGVWSTSSSAINPLNAAFFIGSANQFVVPAFAGPLYLFLANNDGIFADNPSQYGYTVKIKSNVPEPSAISILLAGLILVQRSRKRHGTDAAA